MSEPASAPRTDVVARREGTLGHLTLNRPAALNALDTGMVRAVEAELAAWERDPQVVAILLDGAGEKAFCAGGDIRAVWEAARAGRPGDVAAFFFEEYWLNARIARYPKPIVSVMHGITMGGGIGLGAHASHRLVTERSVLAMPEVKIGFVPDVGGTFLLSRAPGALGLHLALTGGRAGPADAILCGLADRHVPFDRLHELRLGLARCRSVDAVTDCIESLATAPDPGRFAAARGWIDACYAGETVEEILDALNAAPEPEARAAADEISANAPTSLKVALQALRDARRLTLEDCLEREYRVSCSITRDPDFREGVRAAVVDKDRKPAWAPSTLADVSRGDVMRHFAVPEGGDLGLAAG